MTTVFYPNVGDGLESKSRFALIDRLEFLAEAVEEYKAVVFGGREGNTRGMADLPNTQLIAFNWEAMSAILQEVQALPENSKNAKNDKAIYLESIIEMYEVLRGTGMSDLNIIIKQLRDELTRLHR